MRLRHRILTYANKIAPAVLPFKRTLPTYYEGYWFWLARRGWTSLYLGYEPYMADTMRSNLTRGDTFWDIGANVGLFSLLAARIVEPTGNVVSFEPSTEVFRLLCENTDDNRQIRSLQFGIGNIDGSALMSVQGTTSAGSFVKEVVALARHYHPNVPVQEESVEVRKLDTLLNDLKPLPTLVKIDIEGFEVEALKGASLFIQTARPVLIIEVHPLQLKLSGGSEEELHKLLREHNYSFEVINRNENSVYSIVAKPINAQRK